MALLQPQSIWYIIIIEISESQTQLKKTFVILSHVELSYSF